MFSHSLSARVRYNTTNDGNVETEGQENPLVTGCHSLVMCNTITKHEHMSNGKGGDLKLSNRSNYLTSNLFSCGLGQVCGTGLGWFPHSHERCCYDAQYMPMAYNETN